MLIEPLYGDAYWRCTVIKVNALSSSFITWLITPLTWYPSALSASKLSLGDNLVYWLHFVDGSFLLVAFLGSRIMFRERNLSS